VSGVGLVTKLAPVLAAEQRCWLAHRFGATMVLVWWLQVAGTAGFAVVLGAGWLAWRRHGAPGTSRAYMVSLFSVGVLVLAVAVWLVITTA
jgi:hypothetical protein